MIWVVALLVVGSDEFLESMHPRKNARSFSAVGSVLGGNFISILSWCEVYCILKKQAEVKGKTFPICCLFNSGFLEST